MLISCPECNKQISDKAISCPNCGYPMQPIAKVATSKRTTKKYKKLPNGYGQIKHLAGRRRKPYAAYPPTKNYTDDGKPIQTPALGYFATYQEAMECLTDYNKAPYDADYNNLTFANVYEMFFNDKFVKNKKREYSQSTINSTKAAFDNFRSIHNEKFKTLKTADFQNIIDTTKLKHASLELMVSLVKQLFCFALANDITDKDYGKFLKINIPDDDEKGVPFSEEEIAILWQNSTDKTILGLLILIYTGLRINELKTAVFDAKNGVFVGGSKTKAGKNRIIPIHNEILDIVANYDNASISPHSFRISLKNKLNRLNMGVSSEGTVRTPHDARHTFSWLADKYGMDSLSKHLIMGHSLGNDVETNVYGHRTIEELKKEINKIEVKKGAQ